MIRLLQLLANLVALLGRKILDFRENLSFAHAVKLPLERLN